MTPNEGDYAYSGRPHALYYSVCVCVCQLKPRSFIEVTEEVENASGTVPHTLPSHTIHIPSHEQVTLRRPTPLPPNLTLPPPLVCVGVKESVVKECCSELMLILKWGGDLTKLGEAQAERLGAKFTQTMYPDPTYVKALT